MVVLNLLVSSLLLVVTAIYAWLTWRLAKSAHESVMCAVQSVEIARESLMVERSQLRAEFQLLIMPGENCSREGFLEVGSLNLENRGEAITLFRVDVVSVMGILGSSPSWVDLESPLPVDGVQEVSIQSGECLRLTLSPPLTLACVAKIEQFPDGRGVRGLEVDLLFCFGASGERLKRRVRGVVKGEAISFG